VLPGVGSLGVGELVVSSTAAALGRRGRTEARVRIVGASSLGWIEVAEGWGAMIEAVVHGVTADPVVSRGYQHLTRICFGTALNLLPLSPWNGIVLATLDHVEEDRDVMRLLQRWRPLVVVLALNSQVSKPQVRRRVPSLGAGYSTFHWKARHKDLGGVTSSWWHLVRMTRDQSLMAQERHPRMMASTYQRPLQTALDDTESGATGGTFEQRESTLDHVAGFVTVREQGRQRILPVYDGEGWAPDVSQLDHADRFLWVLADSVWGGKERVVRRIVGHELLSIWDYEGKFESRRWDDKMMERVLRSRLKSPPAKILRPVAYPVFEHLL
jgi:hypothetical protein